MLEASRVATAETLSFGQPADVVVSATPGTPGLTLVSSVSARCDVAAFLDQVRRDPVGADGTVAGLVAETRAAITEALRAGSTGVLYWIEGACPAAFTPMQYGGLFLEHDREILADTRAKVEVVVFVADRDDAYTDFVSDLPADLFGWAGTTPEPAEIRALRPGRLLADHPTADVRLVGPVPDRRPR
ncbi:MAG: hypothetical protein KF857_03230 [Fimbriimonadaceae bacterium]|nr:hypothetical protein [Fimbriimonadaceae bacterium]